MDPIRIPRVEYSELADVYYIDGDSQIIESDQIVPGSQIYGTAQIIDSAMVIDGANIIQGVPIIDGSQLRNSDGTYIQGVTIYNGVQNTQSAQNNFYGMNSSGATGVIDIEPASMGIVSNQLTTLDSSSYRQGSGLNYNSSSNVSNNSVNTDGDYKIMTLTGGGVGYVNHGDNDLDDEMKLKLNAPPEIAEVDNFVMQNMPDMGTLDNLNIDFDLNAMDLDREGNFPGLDLGNSNLSQETPFDSYNNVNSSVIQQQPNSTSSTVPRITIRTKKTRKPRNNVIKEESATANLSTISYPPLEMLGIRTSYTTQVSNTNIEYDTPIPHISPIYKEESQSPAYSSPVSPSTSTSSSYSSPSSPSSSSMKPRASLANMSEAERYRHIRNQNNESSRIYRQKKKMGVREAEAELLLLQERNTRLKEVFSAIKQKKELAHTLMKGFVQDASRHRKQ